METNFYFPLSKNRSISKLQVSKTSQEGLGPGLKVSSEISLSRRLETDAFFVTSNAMTIH